MPHRIEHRLGALLLAFWLVFPACQSLYHGRKVAESQRIALPAEAVQEGLWKGDDLIFRYQLIQKQDRLSVSGTLKLDPALIYNYTTLEYLHLRIHFLDDQGRVIGTNHLFSAPRMRAMKERYPVDARPTLPPNAEGVTFGYAGRAWEGGEGPTSWEFWKTP